MVGDYILSRMQSQYEKKLPKRINGSLIFLFSYCAEKRHHGIGVVHIIAGEGNGGYILADNKADLLLINGDSLKNAGGGNAGVGLAAKVELSRGA